MNGLVARRVVQRTYGPLIFVIFPEYYQIGKAPTQPLKSFSFRPP